MTEMCLYKIYFTEGDCEAIGFRSVVTQGQAGLHSGSVPFLWFRLDSSDYSTITDSSST